MGKKKRKHRGQVPTDPDLIAQGVVEIGTQSGAPISKEAQRNLAKLVPGIHKEAMERWREEGLFVENYCPICEREDVETSDHHIIPKHKGGRKRPTVDLCKDCHGQIHALWTNKELKDEFNTLEKLKNSEQMQMFVKFIRKSKGRHVRKKQSNGRKGKN